MAMAEEIGAEEFSAVVARHRVQIFRFLLASTRDVDLAETLTQDCFLKAHRNWKSFRGESSAMTWLMRIAIICRKTTGVTGGCSFGGTREPMRWIWARPASGCRVEKGRPSNSCWRMSGSIR